MILQSAGVVCNIFNAKVSLSPELEIDFRNYFFCTLKNRFQIIWTFTSRQLHVQS